MQVILEEKPIKACSMEASIWSGVSLSFFLDNQCRIPLKKLGTLQSHAHPIAKTIQCQLDAETSGDNTRG
jgi:hypothetical protein